MLLLGGSKSHLSRVRSEAHVRWRWPPTPGSGLTALGKRSPSALSNMHLICYILQSHAAGPLSPDTTPRACCRRQEWALPFRLQPCRPPCFSPSACCQRPPAPSLGTLAIPRIESWARSPNSAADGIKINLRVGLHPALLRCVLYSMPADFAAGLSAGSNVASLVSTIAAPIDAPPAYLVQSAFMSPQQAMGTCCSSVGLRSGL